MKLETIEILLIALLIAYLIIDNVNSSKYSKIAEDFINIPKLDSNTNWKLDNTCKYKISNTVLDVLKDTNVTKTDSNTWSVYVPCGYTDMSGNLNRANKASSNTTHVKRFFIIDNIDELTSKDKLWTNLVNYYGLNNASNFMPVSYILYNSQDLQRFKQEYIKNTIYIMKNNIQRQRGLKITNNYQEVINNFSDNKNNKYLVAQKLLQNCFVLDGRKINMRFYVLLVCRDGEVDAYVHKEGFMYYTKDKFVKNSTLEGPNITTGYIDRAVYDKNPLTHGDFRKYLNKNYSKQQQVDFFNKTYILLGDVINAVASKLGHNKQYNNLNTNITFQLLGADIAVSDQLEPLLMEINKGPDTGAKDARDKEIKYGVVKDMFSIIRGDDKGDFVQIRG